MTMRVRKRLFGGSASLLRRSTMDSSLPSRPTRQETSPYLKTLKYAFPGGIGSRTFMLPSSRCISRESCAFQMRRFCTLKLRRPEKLRLLDDEDEILPGLRCFWTDVHHRSSMAYVIETNCGTVIASDCFFKYMNIEKMIPLGIMESLDECMVAYRWIEKEADILLRLDDPTVLEQLSRVPSKPSINAC